MTQWRENREYLPLVEPARVTPWTILVNRTGEAAMLLTMLAVFVIVMWVALVMGG